MCSVSDKLNGARWSTGRVATSAHAHTHFCYHTRDAHAHTHKQKQQAIAIAFFSQLPPRFILKIILIYWFSFNVAYKLLYYLLTLFLLNSHPVLSLCKFFFVLLPHITQLCSSLIITKLNELLGTIDGRRRCPGPVPRQRCLPSWPWSPGPPPPPHHAPFTVAPQPLKSQCRNTHRTEFIFIQLVNKNVLSSTVNGRTIAERR